MSKILRNRDLGPFHDLLLEACPPSSINEKGKVIHNPDGVKSIEMLSKHLNMSDWGVYLWIKKGRIPPIKAQKVCGLPGSTVTIDQFSPYIYGLALADH
jgi:hypothetical protein